MRSEYKKHAGNVVNVECYEGSDDKLIEEIESCLEEKNLYNRDLNSAFYALEKQKVDEMFSKRKYGEELQYGKIAPRDAASWLRIHQRFSEMESNESRYLLVFGRIKY